MKAFIDRVLGATGKYTAWDFAFLKISLLSLGIIFGAYFANFFLSYTSFLWIVFIVSYLWIMYRTFIKHLK
ncbi:MAG: hypothetical protein CVU87_05775 [Firmicutes bacterium HGW-Firmicutes-12]|jgi:small multidrug resistance family-3 protein|nr:MAG: hypothetical protein CVU87_05775 [Firmicutes bacterium HGW-Firmicutes-12]